MFWKYNITTSSHIDTLLKKEDVTLKELMDEEDILQECKAQSEALINFLIKPQVLNEMVDLITQEPPALTEESLRFKYANISSEILTSDVISINNALIEEEEILDKLYHFLDSTKPLNPLLASFFSKTLGMLIARKTAEVFEFLKTKPDFVPALIRHFNTSAIMDLLWKFVKSVDNMDLKQEIAQWLTEQNTIEQLVDLIAPDKEDNYSDNAARLLCDLVKSNREQMVLMEDEVSNYPLLLRLMDSQTITRLLDNMLREKREHPIVNGIAVLDALLTMEHPGLLDSYHQLLPSSPGLLQPNGQLHPSSPTKSGADALPHLSLQVFYEKALADFHAILLDPPKKDAIRTTIGVLDPPLGATRLEIVHLYHLLLRCNNHRVNLELARLGSLSVILDLFFQYPWNNFLHTQVEHCLGTILDNPPTQSPDGQMCHPLLDQLFTTAHLIQRILEKWDPAEVVQPEAGVSPAPGYRGHLTLIANQVARNSQNRELLDHHIQALPDDLPQKWEAFVLGPLADINERNSIAEVKSISFQSAESGSFQQLGLGKEDQQEAWVSAARIMPPNQNIMELMDMFEFTAENNSHNAEMFEQVCNDRTDSTDIDYSFPRHNWPQRRNSGGSSSSSDSEEDEPSKPAAEAPTNPFKADLFNDSPWTPASTNPPSQDEWSAPPTDRDSWADFSKVKFEDNPPWPNTVSSTDVQSDPFQVRSAPGSHNPFRPENASSLLPDTAAAELPVQPEESCSGGAPQPPEVAPAKEEKEANQKPPPPHSSNLGQEEGTSLIVKPAPEASPLPGIKMEGGDAAISPIISFSSSPPSKESQQCCILPTISSPL